MSDQDTEFADAFKEATEEGTTSEFETTAQDTDNQNDAEETSYSNSDEDQTTVEEEEEYSAEEGQGEETPNYKALYNQAKNEANTWKGRVTQAHEERDQARAALDKKAATNDSLENQTQSGNDPDVEEFFNEYPEMQKPVTAMADKVVATRLADIEAKYDAKIAALESVSTETKVDRHFATIKAAHPDYETVAASKNFTSWVDKQPAYIRASIDQVWQSGSAEEIIDVFNEYKKAGISKTKHKTQGAVNEKADSLLAVRSSSGGPVRNNRQPDNSDFDSAWNEATSS